MLVKAARYSLKKKQYKMQEQIRLMLQTTYEAQKQRALTSLMLLSNNPVGIGDHSTSDFYKNAEEALSMLADADDKLETLKRYDLIWSQKN
jgi:hypothetical protein